MKPINEMTSRELEIEQILRAIARGNAQFAALQETQKRLNEKQRARRLEYDRQQTLALRCDRIFQETLKILEDEKNSPPLRTGNDTDLDPIGYWQGVETPVTRCELPGKVEGAK